MSTSMNPSGAAASDDQVQTGLAYLQSSFASKEVDHIPKPDQYGDLFRVRQGNEVRHQLMVKRKFYDDHKNNLAASLVQKNVHTLMKDAGTRLVELS